MKTKDFLSKLHQYPLGSIVRTTIVVMLMAWTATGNAVTGTWIPNGGYVGTNLSSDDTNKDEPCLELLSTQMDPYTNRVYYNFLLKYCRNTIGSDSYWSPKEDLVLMVNDVAVKRFADFCNINGQKNGDGWDGIKNWHKITNGGYGWASSGNYSNNTFRNNYSNVGVNFYDPEEYAKDCYWVEMRVAIERQWDNLWTNGKAIKIGVRGKWIKKDDSGSMRYLYMNVPAPKNVKYPSAGTLTRTGNKQVQYKCSNMNGSLKGSDKDGEFNWLNSIYLLKNSGNESNPQSSLSSSNYYAKVEAAYGVSEVTRTLTGIDNYQTFTVYPCAEVKSGRNVGPDDSSLSWTQYFTKFYGAISVAGFARATNVQANVQDSYSKKIEVTWTTDNNSGKNSTNGRWYIFRKVTGTSNTQVKLGETAYGTTRFTDTSGNVEYGKSYTYTVCFVPSGWTVNHEDDAAGLSNYGRCTLNREFTITNFTVEEDNGKLKLSWHHSNITDASTSKTYELKIQRQDSQGRWNDIGTVKINNNKTSNGSYTDDQGLQARHSYTYRLMINVQEYDFYSEVVTKMLSGSIITDFTATRGSYNSTVKLSWTVNQRGTAATYFTIQRRPLGRIGEEGWTDIHTTSGTALNYSYEDNTAQPGSFNEYRVILSEYNENNKLEQSDSRTTDGFSLATGNVSGRVSYGSGTAVKDVKITMQPSNADGETESNFRSLTLHGAAAGVQCIADAEATAKIAAGSFSIQMYVKPSNDNGRMDSNGTAYQLLNLKEAFQVLLKYNASNSNYVLGASICGSVSWSNATIPALAWSHVTIVYNNVGNQVLFYITAGDECVAATPIPANVQWGSGDTSSLTLGNNHTFNAANPFQGNVDEFRFFSKALSKEEILKNYNRTLAGSEGELAIYWPMDEGIENGQPVVYDFSRSNGIANGKHGVMSIAAISQTDVPDENQLSLMTYTDNNGNYMIRGVGFSGEGTNYVITPTLGIHQFSPSNKSRFFNLNSLVHSSVDFEDVSSFPVSGRVFYESTTIPVEDAYLYVDGIMASKDGEPVMTNSSGEFSVDVPIGDHFIQVKKNGHTFVGEGRYPADPNGLGLRHNFDGEMKNLTFFDNTLVMIAGRVAGGDIEYEKPLGLEQGVANIGKAILRIEQESERGQLNVAPQDANSTVISYDPNDEPRYFEAEYGTARVPAQKNYIEVETDPVTGEWAAMLPPLYYKVTSVSIPANDKIVASDFSLPSINASNPNIVYTDSIQMENDYRRFKYNAMVKLLYKSPSTLDVKELRVDDKGEVYSDGSFGIHSYKVKDINGTVHDVEVYSPQNGYAFGHPVYEELASYSYSLYAYEEYTNYDDAQNPVVDRVPLAGKEVTVKNQFAYTTSVLLSGEIHEVQDDAFELDEEGKAIYQFGVGYPNIQAPYTRGLSITYNNAGIEEPWSENGKFQAIVLGALPTGNNFVTQGPDEILMVLRDPPGTNSSATWSKGSTSTTTKGLEFDVHASETINTKIYAGVETATAQGVGVMVIQDLESKATLSVGAEVNLAFNTGHEWITSVTSTRDISTSDAPDFVGAVGDVFIGSGKNMVFGACRAVDIYWDNATGTPELKMEESMSVGEQFTTGFAYTQNYVKEVLIPNFVELRNSLLWKVSSTSGISRPASGQEPIYVTTLDENDERFGTSNSDANVWGNRAVPFSQLNDGIYEGPSYTMILPDGYQKKDYQDMVNFYNQQIAKWEYQLGKNEQAKVEAIENRSEWLKENHSFDAGASITQSVTNDKGYTHSYSLSEELNITMGTETGYRFAGLGMGIEVSASAGASAVESLVTEDSYTNTISYTLAEDGGDDYLSVDVFDAPDGYAPIFYTRAGATSCPYEDEVATEYYQPGTVIMQKTVQIEKPEIEAMDPLVTGVPAGGKGTFQMKIFNNSDTKEYCWYDINVIDTTNPNGLVVLMDGVNINKGRSILVPAGQTMYKTVTVEQSNPDVMDYEDVKVRIASQCQKDNTIFPEIADTTEFSVYFQPSCSDVKLASSHRLVNLDTDDTNVKLSISGYNYSMNSLAGIRLQYKSPSDADFTTLQEYTKDATRLASDPNLMELPPLTGANTLDYIVDLGDGSRFADKTYIFRAITVCGSGWREINNESEEISIVRDMTRPQLIANPTPASGVLGSGDNISITFNEDIQNTILNNADNFTVAGILNETRVAHDAALSLSGDNAAKTDATIDLAGKSFTASLWLNYSQDGRVLHHGTADNGFAIDIENGRLAVSVGNWKAASTNVLPKDKWLYLNVSFDDSGEKPIVNADYAQDASTVVLLRNVEAARYEGHGPVAVGGNGLNARMQELALWHVNRTMAEAQGSMYTSKSRYTDGLISYWPMDEGNGSVAADHAHSRNMKLPSQNAWWLNGDNYALVLDGSKGAAAYIHELNTGSGDDYMLEAWFKVDESQSGKATIMACDDLDLRVNAGGQLELDICATGNSVAQTLTSSQGRDLRDGQWHHAAINVLKSTNGSGIVYLDGQPHIQTTAAAMPVLSGRLLHLGAKSVYDEDAGARAVQLLKGAIDEVRIWKGRRSIDIIKKNMFNRVDSTAEGLIAYYPMERTRLNTNQQLVTTESCEDAVNEGYELMMFNDGYSPDQADLSKLNTAPLKVAPTMTNVAFNFVASERQIRIDLTEDPYKTEECNIYITAKNIKDAHGNTALPITWMVYVKQNNLVWGESEIAVTKEGTEDAVFNVEIENKGAQTEAWSLSGMPEWLSADETSGLLSPQTKKTLTFTVAASLPIGTYDAKVNLAGSQGINAPLYLTVASEGSAPHWKAVAGEYTMNIIGQLKIDGVISSDPKDMVAAFRGTECVGVAQPKYIGRYDTYFVMMNIYGNGEAELTYKAYDASSGLVYPSVHISEAGAYTFEGDKAIGSFASPVVFSPLNEIEQELALDHSAWKWFSLYAKPKVNQASIVFKDAKEIIHTITDGNHTLIDWKGPLTSFSFDKMYKLYATDAFDQRIVGEAADPTETSINLNKGWTWIGYPCHTGNSLNAALADANPQEGDMVKNQSAFALYTEGEWVGTLTAMQPGDGYMYSNTASAKTFKFPKPAVTGRMNAPARTMGNVSAMGQGFKDNMTMVAVVTDGGKVVEKAQVSVLAGTELRGLSASALRDGMHFITIGGQTGDNDQLSFVVQTEDGEYLLAQKETFKANAQMGTLSQPYVLQLSQATAIDATRSGLAIKSITLYDGSGKMVRKADSPSRMPSASDLNTLPGGIYFMQVTYDNGQTVIQKMLR